MRKFTAREDSTEKPNPNRECTFDLQQVGRYRMGTMTFEEPHERFGPVTVLSHDAKSGKIFIRKVDKTNAMFTIIKVIDGSAAV